MESIRINETNFLFSMARQPLVGQGLFLIEASLSHSNILHSVGLPFTRDQTATQNSENTNNIHKRQTSMPLVGFEPAIPASKWPQTHNSKGAATWTGK